MSDRRGRKPLALIAATLLALGGVAVGCGGDDEEETAATTTEQTTATTDETTTEETTTTDEGGGGAGIDPADGNPNQGEQIFANNCSTCHGSTGAGAATGPSLQEPDLAEEPSEVVEQIVNGGGGMPAFGGQLSDQEIANVAAFVIEDLAQR